MTVIAIDGPSGSGKSTVARSLAERLGLPYLDTGAMYRAVACAVLRGEVPPDDPDATTALAESVDISVENGRTLLDGDDVSVEIRGPKVTGVVSAVSAHPGVRAELRARQRAWAERNGGGVVEGRDIGTVVFPEADLKVFLTARLDVRAGRRQREIGAAAVQQVASDIARRDDADASRDESPLAVADGAITVDTSDRTVESIVDELLALL
jgi:cytidylate kinase